MDDFIGFMFFLMIVLLTSSITSCDRMIPTKLFPVATKLCGDDGIQSLAGDMNEYTVRCKSGQVYILSETTINLSP